MEHRLGNLLQNLIPAPLSLKYVDVIHAGHNSQG